MRPLKMKEIMEFKGILQAKGAIHIGGDADVVGIGENDNPIIRHPIDNRPYIPGSSIKGKVRSLLELKISARTQESGQPCDCGNSDCLICQVFGCGKLANIRNGSGPTRIVFRDCLPTRETATLWQENTDHEMKTEVTVDRKTCRANPRPMERIPSGSDFDFAFSLRYFEGDDLAGYLNFLAEGFELLEKHYLGGSGSRGYGQVAVVAEDGRPMAEHLRSKAKEV